MVVHFSSWIKKLLFEITAVGAVLHPSLFAAAVSLSDLYTKIFSILNAVDQVIGLWSMQFWIVQFFQCVFTCCVVGCVIVLLNWVFRWYLVLLFKCPVHNSLHFKSKHKPLFHVCTILISVHLFKIRCNWCLLKGCPVLKILMSIWAVQNTV